MEFVSGSIAKILSKALTSIQMKTCRLGLVVDDEGEKNTPSSSTFDKLILPFELPSIEQELKTLAGALKCLETANLDKTDVFDYFVDQAYSNLKN